MEPGAYRGFKGLLGLIPPSPPIPNTENDTEEQQQHSPWDSGQPSSSSASAPAQPRPMDTNWSVDGPNIMRGNFGHEAVGVSENDSGMFVGWGCLEAASALARTGQVSSFGYLDDEITLRPRDPDALTPSAASYPHPNLSVPHPSLRLDFRMSVTLNPRISVGLTPSGHRNWISFTGGSWSGSWGSGIVLPGGQDSQIITSDGSARLETNYLLQTHDEPPAFIVIKTHGWRTGSPEVLARLADPELADKVDPSEYKFRLFIDMETGDERYVEKVNCGMWVGSGMRKGAEVIYDAYRVE